MFADFLKNRRGSISVLSAGAFCAILAVATLVVEGSALYVLKVRQQRTADFAVLAAGNLSGAIASGTASAAAIATAKNIATVNGFDSTDTNVSTSPDGAKLKVSIAKTSNFTVTNMFSSLNAATSLSTALGTPSVGAASCVVSLTAAVTLVNGSNIFGPLCGVVANTYIGITASGMDVKTATVGYNSSVEASLVNGALTLSPPLDKFKYTTPATDALASDTSIAPLKSKLGRMLSGWPYATTSPVAITRISTSWGQNGTYKNTTAVISRSARIGALTVSGSNVTFTGSGSSDSSCQNPTTIDGATTLSGNSTLTFKDGCYVFNGDVTLTTASTVTFAAAPGATLRFVFGGSIINQYAGTLVFPAATYSIAYGLNNLGGGSFNFGAGQKVIGGTLNNGTGVSDLGAGPFYFPATVIRQNTGTLRFGDGPFYFYASSVTNGGSGTMTFGNGPYYVYYSTIANSDGTGSSGPFMSFARGPYYFGWSNLYLNLRSATRIGVGDMDLYYSNVTLYGDSVTFGSSATAATGSSTIALAGGTLTHGAGTLTGYGVTIAQVYGAMTLTGGPIHLTAPTDAAPTFGVQNLLIMNTAGGVVITSTADGTLGGMVYAPSGSIILAGRKSNPVDGCLSFIGFDVWLYTGATANVAPCTSFPGLVTGPGTRALLGG